jgi:hypothetical protein
VVPTRELREGDLLAHPPLPGARQTLSALANAKKSWAELKRGKPGKRFQERYKRKNPGGKRSGKKLATLILGFIVFAAGLFFLPAPGPGIIIVALGAALIAQASLLGARALDWCELKIRALIAWALGVWESAGAVARAAIVMGGIVIAAAGGYGAWWITFGR